MSTDGAGGVALVALVAIVPIVVLMLTSFVKVSVVLALLRNAIGAPDAPSGLVVMGMSLVLTFFVMAPVAVEMAKAAATPVEAPGSPANPRGATPGAADAGKSAEANGEAGAGAVPRKVTGDPVDPYAPGTNAASAGSSSGGPGAGSSSTGAGAGSSAPARLGKLDLDAAMRQLVPAEYWPQLEAATRAVGPLRAFLGKHAAERDRATFVELAKGMGREVRGDEVWVLAPAFLTTELREAFAIAVLVFLPFLVIDLVVGLGLAALGLQATQPQVVALPLKLLLFVAVDGWRLLIESLLRGYV